MDRRSCAPSSIFRPLSSLGRARQVAKSISNITIKLLLFCLLLLSGEAFAQTTTIRGGGSDNVAELSSGGGTRYAQGTVATDTDTMDMMGCERADTAAAQTGVINGDRANCLVDATQRLYTHVGTIDGGTITTITNPVAVTGTFWQATQPVSNAGTFAVQAAQSGIWTVQPGNAANTTPWLTTISQGGNSAAVNASGQLSITCANCSGSGASAVDNSAFTVGTTSGAPAMGRS